MAPALKLVLKPPCNGEFYTMEDVISGEFILDLEKPLSIREIVIKLVGSSETLVRPGEHSTNGTRTSLQVPLEDQHSVHEIMNSEVSVFPPQNVKTAMQGSKKAFKVEQGSYTFRFDFEFPDTPLCLATHPKKLYTFLSNEPNIGLPPSFNNALKTEEVQNLDIYFYSLGKVEYYVEAVVLTGNEDSWFKPFRAASPALKRTFELIPSNFAQKQLQTIMQSANSTPVMTFLSKFDVTFEDDDIRLWLEVRSRQLRSIYRLDYLFLPGCNKFDQIFLIMPLPLPEGSDLRIVGVEINLIEFVTYLAGGRSNSNLNSLRLAKTNADLQIDLSRSYTNSDGDQECLIDIADIETLSKLRFNEEDYRHRGNRLYSLITCNIRRLFKFQLFLHMTLNGRDKFQFEVLTDFVNVFCESVTVEAHPPAYAEEEQLPSYK
ncbi:LAME_0E05842g1_1 [Lachancea meyersii CBS 8951]|uniref:LAME_0E05842g1_1 n=1 Tax=Lachancea meyersii CBS 8951 TaxID=1266667 RepID=A0A1G4JHG2_9SACH|nr:LAME_0E05842g1_1 [Lachancea meyersii CBS 8951]